MTSRVPLLVKNKGRKPTRLPITPKANPVNVTRTKQTNDQASMKPQKLAGKAGVHKESNKINKTETIASAQARKEPTKLTASTDKASSGAKNKASFTSNQIKSPGNTASSSIKVQLPTQLEQNVRLERLTSSKILPPPTSRKDTNTAKNQTQMEFSPSNRKYNQTDTRPRQSPSQSVHHYNPQKSSIPDLSPSSNNSTVQSTVKSVTSDLNISKDSHAIKITKGKRKPKREVVIKIKEEPIEGVLRSGRKRVKRTTESSTVDNSVPRRTSLRRNAKDKAHARSEQLRKLNDYHDRVSNGYYRSCDEYDSDISKDSYIEVKYKDELYSPDEDESTTTMPARTRAKLWAQSILKNQEDAAIKMKEEKDTIKSEKLNHYSPSGLRMRKESIASMTSHARGHGNASGGKHTLSNKVEITKEPSEMTMGELALSIPKGVYGANRTEQEVSVDNYFRGGRKRSWSNMSDASNTSVLSNASNEKVLIAPKVEIIDGIMVVTEASISPPTTMEEDPSFNEVQIGKRLDERGYLHPGIRYLPATKLPGKRWTKDETQQFYYCLSQVGPNFSMMATLFPSRQRKELKSKFKYEEKHHPRLIEMALKASSAPMDNEIVDVISNIVDRTSKKLENPFKIVNNAENSPSEAGDSVVDSVDFEDEYLAIERMERHNSFDFTA